jgi:hypothetical protein
MPSEDLTLRDRFVRWSRTPRSRLFSAVVFLILFVLALALGNTVYAFGWLSLLVATGLLHAASLTHAAREGGARSGPLAYLSIGFLGLGFLLLVTGLVLDFS